MKKQSEYIYISDCQVLNYSVNDMENEKETDGLEEDREFMFFSIPGDGHNYLKEDNGG